MKKFKQILNEFRMTRRPEGNDDGDPRDQVKKFMQTTPFQFKTKEGDLVHFHDSLSAARTLFDNLEQHIEGHNYSANAKLPHMAKYFSKSMNTHGDLLMKLQDHIESHDDLPEYLRGHVSSTIDEIQSQVEEEHKSRKERLASMDFLGRPMGEIGKRVMKYHEMMPITIGDDVRHPYEDNQSHHLKSVIDLVDQSGQDPEAPDLGFVDRKD